jgi:hypothetical protein
MARRVKTLGHEASSRLNMKRYYPILFGFLQFVLTTAFAFLIFITDALGRRILHTPASAMASVVC